jgi:chromosomal replication initiation ATPase DnaA
MHASDEINPLPSDACPPSHTAADSLWQRVLPVLKVRIGSEFDRWFEAAQLTYESGVATISVAGPMQQLWIEMNHMALLREVITDEVSHPVVVKISTLPANVVRSAHDMGKMLPVATVTSVRGAAAPKQEPKVITESTVQTSLADAGLRGRHYQPILRSGS